MIYLCLFAVSTFLLYLAGKCRGVLAGLLAAVGLALPCLLAGFRDETIGVDILSYAKWMFENALALPFGDFMAIETSEAGIGWNLFTWAVVRAAPSMVAYLFAIEALCIVPVYLGLRRMAPGCEWAGMLVWFLTLYAFSMNGMRQSAAMALCFYAFAYVLERRPLPFVLMVTLATLLHQTAVVALVVYPFCALFRPDGAFAALFERWSGVIIAMAAMLVLGAGFVLAPRIVVMAASLKASYSFQVEHLGANNVSYAGLYYFFAFLMLAMGSSRLFAGESERCVFRTLSALILLGFACWQLDFVSDTLGRFGYYGSVYTVLFCALLVKNRGYLQYSVAALAFLLSFVVPTLYLGHYGVYPYVSSVLNIG